MSRPLGSRIALTARRPGLRPRTIRLRLTALYGGLFLLSGVALLAITYTLMWRVSSPVCYQGLNANVCTSGSGPDGPSPTEAPSVHSSGIDPPQLTPKQMRDLALNQHAHEMHQLLVRSGIALAIMAAASIVLGWLVAGRVLRPLRTITHATREISATNLHARLALPGPTDELKQLGDTIDALLARLEGAFDAQRRFVANASHELRTPLTLMRALLQMTLGDPDATLDSFRTTCREAIEAGERQESLIDSLLVLAHSERGLEHREPFDVATIAETVLDGARPLADAADIRLDTSIAGAPADGDARLVERLITNLVDNAIRHNVPGGSVTVATGTRADHAYVLVSNTGPAVPGNEIARLFQPFQRLGADSTDNTEGFGLGLSIVQAIAEAHDATISTEPRPQGGLDIEVTFPQATPRNGGSPASAGRDRVLARR